MSRTRIYQNTSLSVNQQITLDEQSSTHLCKVLRMQIGDSLRIFNGEGLEYLANITKTGKKVEVLLQEKIDTNNESPVHIHLGQVISRGEKMDLTLQKSVELGIASITPLNSERCGVKLATERMDKKQEHWQKVIISACEQSGRNKVPPCQPLQDFYTWVKEEKSDIKLMMDPQGDSSLEQLANLKATTISLAVGPEGGFTEKEVQFAKNHGFVTVKLGPRILRTETAALTLISILQYLYGDFSSRH